MSKRSRSLSTASLSPTPSPVPVQKRPRTQTAFSPIKIATPAVAATVDADPPLGRLLSAVEQCIKNPDKGDSVVYWMRMGDLRISDNRALSLASVQAKDDGVPLVVLFVLSPQDYTAHDRSARRIDFTLRNLAMIKKSLVRLNIPLYTTTHAPRHTLPSHVISLLSTLNATHLFANIEYEVDELRRDTSICARARAKSIKATFVHDRCIVDPGVVLTKDKKNYVVYTPYQRTWLTTLNTNIPYYLEDCPLPHPNPESIRSQKFSALFDTPVPESVPGFELSDEDRKRMDVVWPAGEDVALKILQQFLHTKSRSSQLGTVDPLTSGREDATNGSRVTLYHKERDRCDRDTTSRLSTYLSAGVLSARTCVRATMLLLRIDKVDAGGTTGVGGWVREIAWRDFYTCVLCAFPRVGMGRPFLERFARVVWEGYQVGKGEEGEKKGEGEGTFKRWKDGMTGVPIVDAAMRCLREIGWVHNRLRMIAAMFLSKDLMIDWRVGERYFMEQLIDGDLASNNGGWQWCASTGVDPCPYFRIFNPYTQSLKADPNGDFIRHYVPELAKLKGPDLHNPPAQVADKLGYPRPIVKHGEARKRALRRYKNPGEE